MPRKVTPTVSDAIEDFLRSRHHLSGTTLDNDRSVLRQLAKGIGPDRQMGNVTPAQVERWFAQVCAPNNPKESSYNKARARIALFLQYCARHGWIKIDLLQDVGKKTVPNVERRRLDGKELLRLLDAPGDPRERGLLACGMNTGLRAGELTSIKIKDVDLERGEIYFFRSKTASDDRLPITKRLDGELRKWMTSYAIELGPNMLRGDMLLFPARKPPRLCGGNAPGEPRLMMLGELQPYRPIEHPQRIVQRALRKIGVDVIHQEGVHTLRRSSARLLFEHISEHAGEPGYDSALRTTASFLGHKSTVTTELYLGLSGDRRKRDAILRGNDFLPPDPVDNVIQIRVAR